MTPRLALALLALWIQVSLTTGSLIRKNVEELEKSEIIGLQSALLKMERDTSDKGFRTLAAYHGEPSMCTDIKTNEPQACCLHGMAVFPMWHRLYVKQFEHLLQQHGLSSSIGVPFWDTTKPLTELPSLVRGQIFLDAKGGLAKKNAWFSTDFTVDGQEAHTARAVDERLFEKVPRGKHSRLADMILDALEQDSYCQFEVQFEVAHNHIHYLVGGRHQYSMSTLGYSSYDPIFYLHHSNMDRIFVIWQKLQEKRGKPYDSADCSVEQFRWDLWPFDRASNPVSLTKTFRKAKDLFSHMQLGYDYDDLTLNGMNVDQLYHYLEQRHARERSFAVFSLHGLGFSADARVKVCSDDKHRRHRRRIGDDDHDVKHHCEVAGDFFLLGGPNEKKWEFHLPFYFDVTDALEKLGVDMDGVWDVEVALSHVNGTALNSNLLPKPYGAHRPPKGHHDSESVSFFAEHDHHDREVVVRKDVEELTEEEVYWLRRALSRFQNDTSVDGFQAVAEFHGLPARCPRPDAANRYACCIHGLPTFPHWHRLFVTQVEDELRHRDLHIGIPYWDWTKPGTDIPPLAADVDYEDPYHAGVMYHNPFHDAEVAFKNTRTSRNPLSDLTQTPTYGDHTPLFDGMLLAFEQTDFCDFEVQFEVVHNAIHFLVGGFTQYSLATLHYSAFDPIFFLHHSNVDRLWAIWQELQIRRGLPYRAHCAHTLTHHPLKPFSFEEPLNNNHKTHDHAMPTHIYDYDADLEYTYDTLTFGGMTIEQLDHYLQERQAKDRTFVGIELHNIHVSAWAEIFITAPGGNPVSVGKVAVLGGEKEMDWHFDRLFKLEITDALAGLGLQYDSEFEVTMTIKDVNGGAMNGDTFQHETIFHQPATDRVVEEDSGNKLRVDVNSLTEEQMQNLRDAFQALEEDTTVHGFGQIAAFHGQPTWCPSLAAEKKFACCVHGMPTFAHWHRLLTVQAEDALREKGFKHGLPYWDWTLPMEHLPDIVKEETYTHPKTGQTLDNPLHHGVVDGHKTTRDPSSSLFQENEFDHFTSIGEQVMLAFEQEDFCDFAVQFEMAHNYIHAMVGGNEPYSMASLRYTAYDPLFFLHHSQVDRIWATWQALQKYRGRPYNIANCAMASFHKPLQPFAQTSTTNPDVTTRDHSLPLEVFDYATSFHYTYDNYQFNGLDIAQLEHECTKRHAHDRIFAGFMLQGIKQSALVKFKVCKSSSCFDAGLFYILGDEYEMPWMYDRLYKYEITQQLDKHDVGHLDRYDVQYTVYNLAGDTIGTDTFGNATIIHEFGYGHIDRKSYKEELKVSSHVRRNLESLTQGEAESLKAALHKMQDDGSFESIAEYHGAPGLCKDGDRQVACCVHGMATFPHWHRLYVEQVENALLSHGSAVAMPYWDWTKPIHHLPDLVRKKSYFNSRSQKMEDNPFCTGPIKFDGVDEHTTRDPRPELFDNDYFLQNTLLALEQTSFCDFEIQFEVTHNAFHSLVGGRGQYSLSTLDYSAFDPLFFLYHANTDRIWAIWQALQAYRELPWDQSDCALNHMKDGLHPFDNSDHNDFDLTYKYSHPADVMDYSDRLEYHYDDLKLNDWTIPQLEEVLHQQKSRDRLFAGFLLHNIGTSADVEIYICVATGSGDRDCEHPAGQFSVLGGEYEMPFSFDRLYKFDISDPVKKLGLPLDSSADFDLKIKIHSYNGSYLDPQLLHEPTIIFVPGEHSHQDDKGHTQRDLVRRNVLSLSVPERRSLVLAMRSLQEDHSANGFQALAAFHALPPLCPNPQAQHRYACCAHGSAAFPHWHRLYTVQFEQALHHHGSMVGIPYWDTTRPNDHLPAFVTDAQFHDSELDQDFDNPWAQVHIDFENSDVEREPNLGRLNDKGEHGYDTWMWEQYLLALEQEDYCDFEVQFEIAHNAIHAWVGGSKEHSMAHLHYASYDPLFLIHHSSTDRIFALWQELQRLRGHDPNHVTCALEIMHEPLKPFSFGSPYNLDEHTKEYSRPEDIFNYKDHFHYEYDSLEVLGMSPSQVLDEIHKRQEEDRVFAGFMLKGIGTSARVEFSVCTSANACTAAGDFYILGGSAEMPWMFDHMYKYDITKTLKKAHLDATDDFHFKLAVTSMDGNSVSGHGLREPSVIFQRATRDQGHYEVAPNLVRHDLTELTERDIMSLKSAMRDLQKDTSVMGWQGLASYHGLPALCPTPEAAKHACCVHGMPTFPHWHRLYVLAMEHALIKHGSAVSIPYWDWTRPIEHLPELFTSDTYYDAWQDKVFFNPFVRGYIKSEDGYTVRDPQPELLKVTRDGKHSVLFDEVLLALEQEDFCDFEVQYEVTHNAIHYLVGGHQTYSLSSLHYSSYDPIFFVHHSFVDKVWAVWQELQKRRHKPYERADCAVNFMHETMHPFDSSELDRDITIRDHAEPQSVFNYYHLGYKYDHLDIGGLSLDELEQLIHQHQSHPRVFVGFHLHGIGTSADITFKICEDHHHGCHRAGGIFILGGEKEMPWTFDRLYKYDITDALHEAHIEPEDVFDAHVPFTIDYEIHAVNGSALPKSLIPTPTIIFVPAKDAAHDEDAHTTAGVSVRKNINHLTSAETQSLKKSLQKVMDGHGPMSYQDIASWHGWPGKCHHDGHKVACCHHGMASFPQWHRLYVRVLELAMTLEGAQVGIPYWDWTESFTELPTLVTDDDHNPFNHGEVAELHKTTSRSPRPQLFKDPEHGEESFFYRQILLAFEQHDYCDFEVQFEVTHNAIHSWIGGSSPYGMSTLEFSAYDPIFFLHHSNVDRQFAIWQALQRYRGLDYDSANCNIQELRMNLEPFSWETNPFILIREHSKGTDAFHYNQYAYQYDDLRFHGMSIPELEHLLEEKQSEDHVFLNFMLHGIGTSADVTFDLCDSHDHCEFAGTFAILGGPLEMHWSFDRLFKYDVTSVFRQMHLRPDSDYHVELHIRAVNGTELDSHLLESPSVSFVPGKKGHADRSHHKHHDDHHHADSEDVVRHEVSHMTLEEVNSLKNALYKLQNDQGPNGFEAIAGFHGEPRMCPENATNKYSCCKHGMPVFPHWHRLLTVQFERALRHEGSVVGVPYWDWTRPSKDLPMLFTDPYDSNPFKGYQMSDGHQIARDVQKADLQHVTDEHFEDSLYHQALEMLEETNYCDFEVQYEMLHNAIHALVGGHQTYSMATLDYSAFDPFFMVHHSSIDRLWTIWQELQRMRHKPFNFAVCALRYMREPLEPFAYASVNADEVTRANSRPVEIFDAAKFHYHYDNLDLGGHSLKEVSHMIEDMRSSTRLFAGFVLSGFGTSAEVHVDLEDDQGQKKEVGKFYVLGGEHEMPWAYERVYKLDITEHAANMHLDHTSVFKFDTRVVAYDGKDVKAEMKAPVLVERPPHVDYDVLIVQLSPKNDLPPKIVVRKGTRVRFHKAEPSVTGPLRDVGSYTNSVLCAIPPGDVHAYELEKEHRLAPGDYYFTSNDENKCKAGSRLQITVDVE